MLYCMICIFWQNSYTMCVTEVQSNHPGHIAHGPLTRYVKLRIAHAPGMPGTFSPTPRVSDPDMHHGTCMPHVPWCMAGSLTRGFIWSRWRGKHSRRIRNPQFYISAKRPVEQYGFVYKVYILCRTIYANSTLSAIWPSSTWVCYTRILVWADRCASLTSFLHTNMNDRAIIWDMFYGLKRNGKNLVSWLSRDMAQ